MNNRSEEHKAALSETLKILSRKDVSIAVLKNTLIQKGFSINVVDRTIEDIIEQRWYNESDAALRVAHAKMRSTPVGSHKLRYFLSSKQFPELIVENTVDTIFAELSEYSVGLRIAEKKKTSVQKKHAEQPQKIFASLYRYLSQKGFSHDVCYDILKKLNIHNT